MTRWILILVALAALVAGWRYFHHSENAPQETRPDTGTGQRSGSGDKADRSAPGDRGGKGPTDPNRPVPVLVAPVQRTDVPILLEGLGSVIAFKTVTVMSQVDGRLVKVAFTEGQEVKEGDLLAQIDPRPFAIQLRQAQAALAKDRAALKDNKLNLDRYIGLRKQNLMQQQMVDDQLALVEQGQAQIMADEAAIDNAKLNLDYARITSPINGKTGVRLVDQGNLIHSATNTGLVVITQLDPIAVLFTLPEDVLPEVFREMGKAPLTAQAQSRDGATDLGTGTVALVDNQINQATGTIRLKAVFDNPQRMLWPNQFVKIRLLLMTRKGALVVPASTVQRGPQGVFAYVVGADETAELRPITVDVIAGNQAIITAGLSVGEKVVTDGQYQLKPGAKMSIRKPEAKNGAKSDAKPTGKPDGHQDAGSATKQDPSQAAPTAGGGHP